MPQPKDFTEKQKACCEALGLDPKTVSFEHRFHIMYDGIVRYVQMDGGIVPPLEEAGAARPKGRRKVD
jgi:hypothetical protein